MRWGVILFNLPWWLLWSWWNAFHVVQVDRRICSEIPELQRLVDTIISALTHGDSEMMKYHQINSSMQCSWATSPSYLQNPPGPVDISHALIGTSITLLSFPCSAVLLASHCLWRHQRGSDWVGGAGKHRVSQERQELGVTGGLGLHMIAHSSWEGQCLCGQSC